MTNFVRVNLIVEGQTEETFVRDSIARELANKQVYLSHRLVKIGSGRGGLLTMPLRAVTSNAGSRRIVKPM